MKRFLYALLIALQCLTSVAHAEMKRFDVDKTEVLAWLPDGYTKSKEKYPLLVFSHGFGGCPMQSVYLTSALAHAGFIVLAPRHRRP